MSQRNLTVDRLKSEGLERVVHFHCDHFEPHDWMVKRFSLEWITDYLSRTVETPSTLFVFLRHRIWLKGSAPISANRMWSLPDDNVVFGDVNDPEKWYLTIQSAKDLGYDFGIHLHHEFWTSNDWPISAVHPDDRPVWQYVRQSPNELRDRLRVRHSLVLSRRMLEEMLGEPLRNWGFVHGCWALAGGDREICNIEDELGSLYAAGCVADFSFPAGRQHCDPDIRRPFWLWPIAGVQPWKQEAAEAEPVGGTRFQPGRFLIWNSGRSKWSCSIDHYSRPIPVADKMQHRLLSFMGHDMPVINGTGYIKTHAHSMHPHYWDADVLSPLEAFNPSLAWLRGVCEASGVPLESSTASRVINELRDMKAPHAPQSTEQRE